MDNEYNDRIYRKLFGFFESAALIHLKLLNGDFRNGVIISLNKENGVMILNERKFGQVPILFEEIKESSIQIYNTKDGAEKC